MLSRLRFGSQLTVVRIEASGFCTAVAAIQSSPASVSLCSEFGEEGFGFDESFHPRCFIQPLHSQTQCPVTRTSLCSYFKHRLSLLIFIVGDDGSPGSNFEGCLPAHTAYLGVNSSNFKWFCHTALSPQWGLSFLDLASPVSPLAAWEMTALTTVQALEGSWGPLRSLDGRGKVGTGCWESDPEGGMSALSSGSKGACLGWGTHIYLWRIHFDIWQN